METGRLGHFLQPAHSLCDMYLLHPLYEYDPGDCIAASPLLPKVPFWIPLRIQILWLSGRALQSIHI